MQGYLQKNHRLELGIISSFWFKTSRIPQALCPKNLDKYSTGLSKSQEIQTIYTLSEFKKIN